MDRSKPPSSSRGVKGKITQHPPDLFALGSKPSSSRDSEAKRSSSSHSKFGSSSHSSISNPLKDRKRDGSSSSLPTIPSKKPKVFPLPPGAKPPSVSLPPTITSTPTPVSEQWESSIIESDEGDLVSNVLTAADNDDTERAIGYFLGGLKQLRNQKFKPELLLVTSLSFIAKMKPSIIRNETVTQAIFSLLRKESSSTFKSKGNPQLATFAISLLMKGYEEIPNWPQSFFKYYLDDSLGERLWVDHEVCSAFVENMQMAFNTKTPPKALLQLELSALGNRTDTGSPLTINEDELGSESGGMKKRNLLEKCNISVFPRYSHMVEYIEQMVFNAAKEHLVRKQPPENVTKNFLRFLAVASGLVEIRMLAVSKLEMWLHNAKLMRSAQDLLVYVCYNSVAETQRDIEVISHLIKIRLKTKALNNVFLNSLRDMIATHDENVPVILKHTIYNELSNTRNPNNMLMIGVIFQTCPEQAANVLAEIFLELLLNKDDYLRPLRALLREVVRVLRYDIDMYVFCHALIRERKETTNALREFEFRERMFTSIADLICLCMFLAVSPSVREAANLFARGERKELHTLQRFQNQIAKIQSDALWWLHDTVPRVYRTNPADFITTLRKVLLLDPIENYCKHDMWPTENDRNILMRLCTEVPLLQGTLIRILLIGLSKEHPLQQMETLDFCDPLIKRAAAITMENVSMLDFDKIEIIDLIFNLCTYHHPENITLPVGYTPPQLAISNLYWKGWIMLLIISAHNPITFGSIAWEKYPTLRIFMEMCITNHFSYPPPTMAMCDNYEELKTKELQIAALEKQQILEFESHLAAASTKISINETNSLLLPQLITMAPVGVSRRPPPSVLDQLRTLNASLRLGHLLCRSRRPDFLLDIIQRQGPSQHMPWLADLVQNSEGALSHLPVQCLCEFLLSSGLNLSSEKSDRLIRSKHAQLVAHLHTLLTNSEQSPAAASEVLEYFLRRLSSPHYSSRVQAIKGIKLVLQPTDDDALETEQTEEGEAWLLKQLTAMPHFEVVRPQIIIALRQACQVENDPKYISSYIQFLQQHSCMDSYPEMAELVFDMAQLIVERSTIIAAILPAIDDPILTGTQCLSACIIIYSAFLQKAKEVNREAYQWSEIQEQVMIEWENGEQCIIQLLVIHAIIILLTYGPVTESEELYSNLLEQWFPIHGEPPKAYSIDTSEQLLYIPDWLKLRMIRSNVSHLVDAALVGLDQSKLMLFIQSFGVPIASMSKLLHALDVAVTEDHVAFSEAVLDRTYMAQLVEVQRRRGAVGGEIFVKALQLHEPVTGDDNRNKFVYWRSGLPDKRMELGDIGKQFKMHPQWVGTLLNAIFFKAPYQGNLNEDFRQLLRILPLEAKSRDKSLILTIGNYLIQHSNSTAFCQAAIDNSFFTTKLLRIFFSKNINRKLITPLFEMFLRFHDHFKDPLQNSSLNLLLSHYKNSLQAKSILKTPEFIPGDPNVLLRTANAVTLEKVGRQLLEQGLEHHNNPILVEAIAQRLINLKHERNEFDPAGLLIDWLASIEPELIGSSPDLQMDLMFSTSRSNSFRAYLQTLLVHRANWCTLHRCIGHLLIDCNTRYDPTAVLDFLGALSRNPKLLQGRDKNIPKNVKTEDMLELSQMELKSLVNYMLEEAYLIARASHEDISANTDLRIPLLLQCISDNPIAISYVARYLLFIVKTEEQKQICNKVETIIILDEDKDDAKENCKFLRQKIAEQFLLLMYMHIPRIIHHIPIGDRDKIFKKVFLTEWSSSTLDKISHCLLTAIAANPHIKDWQKRTNEYELMIRKMCASHPVLILRQLPMIASSLRGRTHLDFNVFRSRNHLNLFTQILGVVELLQPYVYMAEYRMGLEDTLTTFFSLFRYHGRVKDLVPLLIRFINILQAYITYDANKALKFLQKHAHLLNDLQHFHSNLSTLRDLMTGILLPKIESEATDNDGGDVLVAVIPPAVQEQLPQNWDQLIINLTKLQGDEVFTALQDIDHLSNRKPSILASIINELCRLVMSPTCNIRVLAFTLVTRLLKFSPSDDDAVVSTVFTATLRCLDSSNTDIVVTTLEKLPELIACMQENAVPILEKVFTLGIGSDINTASYINKTINLLNLQIGC